MWRLKWMVYAKIKANMWRLWGMLALGYIIFWFFLLVWWFIPATSEFYGFVALSWPEALAAVLFCTVGLFAMIFCFFVIRAAIEP